MPLSTQALLLRVLESGEFIRVGSNEVQKTNVRIVAATNKDLQRAMLEGSFREDLYYRLAAVPIKIPPLRERKDDIPRLFRKFAGEFAEQHCIPKVTLTEDAYERLCNCYWRGNIRQLKNFAESVPMLIQEREITGAMIEPYLPDEGSARLPMATMRTDEGKSDGRERDLLLQVMELMKAKMEEMEKEIKELKETRQSKPMVGEYGTVNVAKGSDITDVEEYRDDRLSFRDVEREALIKALRKNNGNRRKTAEELGVSIRTIYRKLEQYNLDL